MNVDQYAIKELQMISV